MVDGMFNSASRLALLHPHTKPTRHAVEHLRDLRYRDGAMREHLLDVWRPAQLTISSPPPFRRYAGPPWPIVFYVHGGGFRILSKDTHWIMGLLFARRGFLVFNVSYRLAPRHRYPAAIEDVCLAFAWMIENAARFGGDTSRVVLAGESAGANLVASLAVALAYERDEPYARAAYSTGVVPNAVVPACGVFQVSDMARFQRAKPRISTFVADRLREIEQAYLGSVACEASLDLADPLLVFERGSVPSRALPPFFLPVGTRDPLLPDTRRLGAALRTLGATAEEKYYGGELHAFHAFVLRTQARACWHDIFAFLDRHVPTDAPATSAFVSR